jgi:hypothetical protein
MPNCAGVTFLYCASDFHDALAALGTNMKLGKSCWRATKFRWAVGSTRNPLAEARWRSMMVYWSGSGRSVRASILNDWILTPPLSWPLAR